MVGSISVLAQGEPRRFISSGHPIEQQLRPEDRSVVLISNLPPPLLVELPPDAIRAMTDNTAVSVFGVAVRKEAQLTHDRAWITSTITMRVDRAFRSAESVSSNVGAFVQFDESGGRTQVGRVAVEAVVPWSRPIRVGERYLVFGAIQWDGSLVTGPASIYELTRPQFGLARFRSLMASDGEPQPPNEIHELLPDEVLDRIERRLESAQR